MGAADAGAQFDHSDAVRRSTADLIPHLYEELTNFARACVRRCALRPAPDPRGIVHESYLRLAAQNHDWDNAGHLFAAAVRVIRFIVIERIRQSRTRKHGGKMRQQPFCVDTIAWHVTCDEVLDLKTALARLQVENPHHARLVNLRYYSGLSVHETARCMGVSTSAVRQHWYELRTWFHRQLPDHTHIKTGLSANGPPAARGSKGWSVLMLANGGSA